MTDTQTTNDLLTSSLVAAHYELGEYLHHYYRCRALLSRANRSGDRANRRYALILLNRSRARVNRQRRRIAGILDTLISGRVDAKILTHV